ncbi:glycine cleavage system protein GcvH [Paenibacillus pasadenensis]|uniref:Glycine cleavage system H protein n=1 Tax=Paenibacillus pasadenensis TaxID=217090 RepID=A0A2N5NAX1_9BACL|nr:MULTISPECIES: glycine cleavage system protein GcvH [Paenibacillus]PLT47507.1 Glycine cleavage system H protein [Paenibacillus pasadenensis]QGG57749.1 glycine cleavage system protein GcvH [Paenibacillus sp. B01]
MSEIRQGLGYTEEHEWASAAGENAVRIGITDHAQHQLGDIVFVELPRPGDRVEAGQPLGTIESVKTVSDLYAPVSGTVAKVNDALSDSPELVNSEPYDGGWMLEIETDGSAAELVASLLDADAYAGRTD